MTDTPNPTKGWPTLPTDEWIDTIEALHLWTQIVGKIRLGHAPWLNHSWSVPLYVSTSTPPPANNDRSRFNPNRWPTSTKRSSAP